MTILISVIHIFASTIIFNTILSQLQTFSVQRWSIMNTKLTKKKKKTKIKVPLALLQSILYIMLIFVVPLYDAVCVPFAQHISGFESANCYWIQQLSPRWLQLSSKMKDERWLYSLTRKSQYSRSHHSFSFLDSEMYIAFGLIELLYKQSLAGMQSFLTAVTHCRYPFGFFLS
ncbi:NRT1-PTR FAMILY 4-3 protein [Nymphaea thermarum]|nr:NRT1-PTR FAMILY 4-3 protein [Nymphaea thermarum]